MSICSLFIFYSDNRSFERLSHRLLASPRGHIPSSDRRRRERRWRSAGSLMQCLEGGSEAGKGHEMSFCGGGGKRKMKVARASNHAPLHPDLVNHIHTHLSKFKSTKVTAIIPTEHFVIEGDASRLSIPSKQFCLVIFTLHMLCAEDGSARAGRHVLHTYRTRYTLTRHDNRWRESEKMKRRPPSLTTTWRGRRRERR